MIWKTSEKTMKQKHKTQWRATPADWNKMKTKISEFEDEMEIKRKTEELLVKQLKTSEKNMKELTNSIKRPNLRITGIDGEEVQAKGLCNVFNKIITENFPNLEKTMPIQV
jgi:wyosine [tRNA(Phe)-imidazoG37] synthetase (radical SAM superfamily)